MPKKTPAPAQPMRKRLTIDYRWKCDSFPDGDFPKDLAEALEESAQERIFKMLTEGFTSGELCDFVNMDLPGVKTPEDGFACTGWFEIKTENAG